MLPSLREGKSRGHISEGWCWLSGEGAPTTPPSWEPSLLAPGFLLTSPAPAALHWLEHQHPASSPSAPWSCSRDLSVPSGTGDPPQGTFGVPRRVGLVPGRGSFPCHSPRLFPVTVPDLSLSQSPRSPPCPWCAEEDFQWFLLGAFNTCSCNTKQDVLCRAL